MKELQLFSSHVLIRSSLKIFKNGNECTHFRHYKKKNHARNKTCRKYSTVKNTTTTSTSTGARDLYSFPRECAERDAIGCSHRRGNERARAEIFFIFSWALKSFWSRGVFLKISRALLERARCSRTREGNETDEKRARRRAAFSRSRAFLGFYEGSAGDFLPRFVLLSPLSS